MSSTGGVCAVLVVNGHHEYHQGCKLPVDAVGVRTSRTSASQGALLKLSLQSSIKSLDTRLLVLRLSSLPSGRQ